jgi:hypothetical protein
MAVHIVAWLQDMWQLLMGANGFMQRARYSYTRPPTGVRYANLDTLVSCQFAGYVLGVVRLHHPTAESLNVLAGLAYLMWVGRRPVKATASWVMPWNLERVEFCPRWRGATIGSVS